MNEQAYAKQHRRSELSQLTSAALGDLITAAGYQLMGMHRKQDKVSALLHIEGFAVAAAIVADLKLVRLETIDTVLESAL